MCRQFVVSDYTRPFIPAAATVLQLFPYEEAVPQCLSHVENFLSTKILCEKHQRIVSTSLHDEVQVEQRLHRVNRVFSNMEHNIYQENRPQM